jgi:hypothetical protein
VACEFDGDALTPEADDHDDTQPFMRRVLSDAIFPTNAKTHEDSSIMKRFHLLTASLAAAAALALPTAALAGFVWSEQAPDAGDLLATAQGTFDSSFNTMDGISGFLTNTTGAYDVDLFQIRIADPAAFSATMVGDPLDFALFLFDGAGLGVFMSDDNPYPNPLLPGLPGALPAGVYYLAVALALSNPVDALDTSIFESTGSPVENADIAAGTLAGWQLNPSFAGSPFEYNILLTGATNSDLPEPATLALLMAGGIGAWLSSRRRKCTDTPTAQTRIAA